jgi:hypothetical protein
MTLKEENLHLMKTLDDAWNSQDWDTFSRRHTNDVIVRWPGQTEPTRGLEAHKNEGVEMLKYFLTTTLKIIRIKYFLVKGIGLARLQYSRARIRVRCQALEINQFHLLTRNFKLIFVRWPTGIMVRLTKRIFSTI